MNKKVLIGLVAGVLLLGVCGFCLLGGGLVALMGGNEVEQVNTVSSDLIISDIDTTGEIEEPVVTDSTQDKSARERAIDTADSFMSALKAGDFAQDYDLSSAELQAELQSPEALQGIIEANSIRPESWQWENKTLDMENKLMIMEGQVVFADGRTGIVNLELELKSSDWDGDWKVYYLNLEPSS